MRYCLVILFVCCSLSLTARRQNTQRATRYYHEALKLYSEKHKEDAIYQLRQAIYADSAWADPYAMLGQWLFDEHRFSEAALVFSDASLYCRHGGPRFAKALVKSLLYNAQPAKAVIIINAYTTARDSLDWEPYRQQAYFIQKAIINQLPVMPVSIGDKINTPDPELFPSVTRDTSTLYFTRRVNNNNEDLFKAVMEDTCVEWKGVENLGDLLNSPNEESAQFISADGHYLFFTRSDNRSENGWSNGGCDLYMAYRVRPEDDWTIPQAFGATINTPYYEGMPSLSPDNRELFFVSDRPGGYGGLDIWISRFEEGTWQLPVNAGPGINTAGNEVSPYISTDSRTLYFSSDGWPGMGGKDLFRSSKVTDTIWSKAENLGFPINTVCDEMSECLSADGKKLYFASDRKGPAGNYDIFITNLPPALRPVPVKYLEGFVYDSLTTDRLNYAQIFVLGARSGDTLFQFQSNRGDGSYMVTLPAGAIYVMRTARMGYTDVDDTFVLDEKNLDKTVEKNIVMLPFDYKEIKPINDSLIATIHFDPNKIDLSADEKRILKDAIAPWMDEKGIMFFVSAYTDNTGTPLINEELSYKRAGLITRELVRLGVEELTILSKGYGESKMIAPNDTEEGRRKNRRVEVMIKR